MSESAREAILARVRQALRQPAPEPHWNTDEVRTGPWFPLPGPTAGELTARFREEFAAVQGEWHEAATRFDGQAWLKTWLFEREINAALATDCPLLRELLGDAPGVRWVGAASTEPAERADWPEIPLGITPCESLVAESGTIVVSAASSGRALSVLPPNHLVIATQDQLVADLETSMARLRARYGAELPSSLTWITGPSRTADIEKILVLGAHGPRRLTLLVVPSE